MGNGEQVNKMYVSKKDRELIRMKFDNKCAYTGTELKADWQIDHMKPIIRNTWTGEMHNAENHCIDNLYPVQKIVNHYKGALDLETFRRWYLQGLCERLKKLPKNSSVERTINRKKYLYEVAELFGISETKPFTGKFYFETLTPLIPDNK